MPISTKAKIAAWQQHKYTAAFARCPSRSGMNGIRPEDVDTSQVGPHTSIGFIVGMRTYSFETVEGRDKFVELYATFGAQPCEDPYP